MKIAVLYKSNTGNTKKYATMISKELMCKAYDITLTDKKALYQYDTIIYGGPVIIYKIKKLRQAKRLCKGKKMIIFACGGNPGIEEEIRKIKNTNIPNNEYPFFYLPGGLNFAKQKGIFKFGLTLVKKWIEKKQERKEKYDKFLKSFYEPISYIKEENIIDLISFVNTL